MTVFAEVLEIRNGRNQSNVANPRALMEIMKDEIDNGNHCGDMKIKDGAFMPFEVRKRRIFRFGEIAV